MRSRTESVISRICASNRIMARFHRITGLRAGDNPIPAGRAGGPALFFSTGLLSSLENGVIAFPSTGVDGGAGGSGRARPGLRGHGARSGPGPAPAGISAPVFGGDHPRPAPLDRAGVRLPEAKS